ncbi:hypothetical protein evm_002986 [Chilo suppressalis]|nr:hypothetical protein evm_002986 [Chilo suppressalis]
MSTRSGKRIHGSFHENSTKALDEAITKSERKTRSKRLKENFNETVVAKKRTNYVSYPAGEDINENIVTVSVFETNSKGSPKEVLKEKNINTSLNVDETESGMYTRQTRRTRRSNGNAEEITENGISEDAPKKKKKSKKNKKMSKTVKNPEETANQVVVVPVAKKTKKKKSKQKMVSVSPNKSSGSQDSFHSAAGSPVQEEFSNISKSQSEPVRKSPRRSLKRKTEDSLDCEIDTQDRSIKKTKLMNHADISSVENDHLSGSMSSTVDKVKDTHTTFNNSCKDVEEILNATFDKETEKSQNDNLKNSRFDTTQSPTVKLNSTYEKKDTTAEVNLTFEKDPKSSKRSLRSSTILNKESPVQKLNSTFDKSKESGQTSLNSTYDKETKLNVTDEKHKSLSIPKKKSSTISSDGSANLTFDKSNDGSRISITSDDSNANNIINTTPVLIESSIDESQVLDSSKEINCSPQEKSKLIISPEMTTKENSKVTTTPLKREGTFTKESSDIIAMSPKPRLSSGRTPVKQNSLPSAGCTPFHVSRSSQREKSILNLTHSIEKSKRRSSLAEVVPRTTKVMFCSPVNNPMVVMQQKRKVIKSNLKGSNKSFVFDESMSDKSRAAPRKRSLTHNDVEDARTKRKRLGDALQTSVDRLSRPRSTSVTVKLSEPSTPSKRASIQKTLTPSKSKTESKLARTKLPNFAALHQKQFDRMESLDECQERRARRAKLLLTPPSRGPDSSPITKAAAFTESAKIVAESSKKTDTPKKAPRASAKLSTQPKAKTAAPSTQPKASVPTTEPKLPALPTLESLRPGYTRFGFKMHTDGNPFSIPATQPTQTKAKEFKANGLGNRQHTQPSLTGTTLRKEAAKQMVMREKSFTSLGDKRSVKRKENRTMIKGVRTNRRFELQMQMRNVNA